jgi:hypothetical protein
MTVVDLVDRGVGVLDDRVERRAAAVQQVWVMRWNSARVSFSSRCSGPSAPAVMYGRLI